MLLILSGISTNSLILPGPFYCFWMFSRWIFHSKNWASKAFKAKKKRKIKDWPQYTHIYPAPPIEYTVSSRIFFSCGGEKVLLYLGGARMLKWLYIMETLEYLGRHGYMGYAKIQLTHEDNHWSSQFFPQGHLADIQREQLATILKT